MSVSTPITIDDETYRQALEVFVVDNAELESLEARLGQFNIFDAIGVARQELRHSDFLAFLLDPRQSHGLGDVLLKRLLQKALVAARQATAPIGPIDLDVWSLDRVVVQREWRNIDLLLTDESHQLAVIIENKIGSAEHSDQLGRYLRIVQETYPGWRVLPLYLTPDGDVPSDENYVAVDYGLVCETVDAVTESRRVVLDPAAHSLMVHYARMLRREVVSDSEIAELCRRIYQKHKRALDLIYEHRPSLRDDLSRLLLALVNSDPDFVIDESSRQSLRFAHRAWDTALLKQGTAWKSGRILQFEFQHQPRQLDLVLFVSPGPSEVRQALVNAARAHKPPFTVGKGQGGDWTTIFRRTFLRASDYVDATVEGTGARVKESWVAFLAHDLPSIVDALRIDAPISTEIL